MADALTMYYHVLQDRCDESVVRDTRVEHRAKLAHENRTAETFEVTSGCCLAVYAVGHHVSWLGRLGAHYLRGLGGSRKFMVHCPVRSFHSYRIRTVKLHCNTECLFTIQIN